MSNKKYPDFPAVGATAGLIYLLADPVTGALYKIVYAAPTAATLAAVLAAGNIGDTSMTIRNGAATSDYIQVVPIGGSPYLVINKASGGNMSLLFDYLNATHAIEFPNDDGTLCLSVDGETPSTAGAIILPNKPTIIASDASGHANTGSTTENTVYTATIPANSLGANGRLSVIFLCTNSVNSANAKTIRFKISGTLLWSFDMANIRTAKYQYDLFNRNNTSLQLVGSTTALYNAGWGTGTNTTGAATQAFNTTTNLTFTVTIQNANAGESTTLEAIQLIAYKHA